MGSKIDMPTDWIEYTSKRVLIFLPALRRIAERVLIERPGRNEPRKKKRRPKSYGWLQKPRHSYFEHFRDAPPRKILDEAV
ncbi:MAG: hypothetical protein ACI8T1_003604 [Verrucomicrobiales bacterium]|jgi:hypothetical protein